MTATWRPTEEEAEAQTQEAMRGVTSPLPHGELKTVCSHDLNNMKIQKNNLRQLNIKCSEGVFFSLRHLKEC